MSQIAYDLFRNLLVVMTDDRLAPPTRNKLLHETLVLVCAEALKDTHFGFGDLNSQAERVIRLLHVPVDEANALRKARRDSNRSRALLPEELRYDAMALARLISRVFHCDIPGELAALIPHDTFFAEQSGLKANSADKRCIVKSFDEHVIKVIVDEDGEDGLRTVRYTERNQYARMEYLYGILKEGMHLNLLGCQVEDGVITPRLIIVEPDCLMDISVIASCFEDYGHHPLMYLLGRMKEKANTQAILLGNYAGACLDDIINDKKFSPAKTLVENFRDKALEYATCHGFDGSKFKEDAARQARNLVGIVDELARHHDLSKAILEPTFVCEKLGLQGRVDLMTTDLRLLVEQKSGRNIFLERKTKNAHGARVVEKHYVQVLLYYGILYYNFHVSEPDIRLLYSKYPLPDGLLGVTSLMQLVYEALRFRNEAMAVEFDIAENGMEHILPQLTERTLNTAHMGGFFYDVYLRPQLVSLLSPLHRLGTVERAYFCRMMRFVVRENIMSRIGVVEGVGGCMANLWNMPLAEKRETGNIYTSLTLEHASASSERDGTVGCDDKSMMVFAVPSQGDDFLPNFRRGDMVYVYSYPKGEEPDVRRAILFKGGLAEIHAGKVVVKLVDKQQNRELLEGALVGREERLWAIEHAGSDVGGSAAIRSLYEFVTTTQDRKDLLLGLRVPKRDKTMTLSRVYNPTVDDIILRVKQAKDYFLLVGPPGTGKTSMALQYMVKESLLPCAQLRDGNTDAGDADEWNVTGLEAHDGESHVVEPHADKIGDDGPSLLLMAYTNRAVDEICGMLCDNGIDFIRIGSELSCADAYAPYLLKKRVGEKPTLAGMRRLLLGTHVIVGTTSMIQSRSYLFNVKRFSLAIIDEASQILEPNLIGLLSKQEIEKFVLIGDYKQLPAVVQQGDVDSGIVEPELVKLGFTDCKQSLFERLVRQERKAGRMDFIGTLRRQGRMHPEIAEFPNREFYSAENLEPVPLPHQSSASLGYKHLSLDATDDLLKKHRMVFIASRDCRQPEISDKVNADEARIVADVLCRIHRFYGKEFDTDKTVGVIVPYRNQIAMIRNEIEKTGIAGLGGISIDTVERYQGSQRDVIIYSFTIQHGYQLDFLTANTFEEDGHVIDRKLNVALTRARKQLIMTGNPRILGASCLFLRLIAHVRAKGGYVEAYGDGSFIRDHA